MLLLFRITVYSSFESHFSCRDWKVSSVFALTSESSWLYSWSPYLLLAFERFFRFLMCLKKYFLISASAMLIKKRRMA